MVSSFELVTVFEVEGGFGFRFLPFCVCVCVWQIRVHDGFMILIMKADRWNIGYWVTRALLCKKAPFRGNNQNKQTSSKR